MSPPMNGFTFAGWIAMLSGMWFLFETSENVAAHDTRVRVTRWLQNLDAGEIAPRWPHHFVSIFDRMFGDHHLTWKCFRRSSIASVVSVIVLATLSAALHPDRRILGHDAISGAESWRAPLYFGVLVVLINVFPDYVSLLKTRVLLGRIVDSSNRMAARMMVVVDFASTIAIAFIAIQVAQLVLSPIGNAMGGIPVDFLAAVENGYMQEFTTLVSGGYNWHNSRVFSSMFSLSLESKCYFLCFPWGVWVFASFFTSAWMWLYVVAGTVIRLAARLGLSFRLLNTEDKPIASLGYLAMLLMTMGYWTIALLRWTGVL